MAATGVARDGGLRASDEQPRVVVSAARPRPWHPRPQPLYTLFDRFGDRRSVLRADPPQLYPRSIEDLRNVDNHPHPQTLALDLAYVRSHCVRCQRQVLSIDLDRPRRLPVRQPVYLQVPVTQQLELDPVVPE